MKRFFVNLVVLVAFVVGFDTTANAQWWVPKVAPLSIEGAKFERVEEVRAFDNRPAITIQTDEMSSEPVKWTVTSTGPVVVQRGFLRFASHTECENYGVFVKIGTPSTLAPATTVIQSEAISNVSTLLSQVAYEGWYDGSDTISFQICDQLGNNCREVSVQHFGVTGVDAQVRETYRAQSVKVTVVGDTLASTYLLQPMFVSDVLFPTDLTGLYNGREWLKTALEVPSDGGSDKRVFKITARTRGYQEVRISALIRHKK